MLRKPGTIYVLLAISFLLIVGAFMFVENLQINATHRRVLEQREEIRKESGRITKQLEELRKENERITKQLEGR